MSRLSINFEALRIPTQRLLLAGREQLGDDLG